jgi:acetoin utilization deacetylase AcuC-like enzyme
MFEILFQTLHNDNLYRPQNKIAAGIWDKELHEGMQAMNTDPSEESEKQTRLEMIRQALKDRAPLMHEDLESSGRLQQFLEAHDAEMIASYNEAKNRAWEETKDNFLNFTDISCDETSSPM